MNAICMIIMQMIHMIQLINTQVSLDANLVNSPYNILLSTIDDTWPKVIHDKYFASKPLFDESKARIPSLWIFHYNDGSQVRFWEDIWFLDVNHMFGSWLVNVDKNLKSLAKQDSHVMVAAALQQLMPLELSWLAP
ncbi:hypothetical protein ACJX0J_033067 [Zea mays]